MSNIIRLPGFIDIHVHFRDPGETEKEDFLSGTRAALYGGNIAVFDMPNNKEPIFTYEKLIEKIKIAEVKAFCDWGLYFGSDGENIAEFEKVYKLVAGLKLYLNKTTGEYLIAYRKKIEDIFKNWPKDKIIMVHAEGEMIDLLLSISTNHKNRIHITHVSAKSALEKIIRAKKHSDRITCDVTTHHLLLNQFDANQMEGFGKVKPVLETSQDIEFIWNNLKYVDCIATDHAPHTKHEKESQNPPFGLPGVETRLFLLMQKVYEKKLTMDELIRLTDVGPRSIFNLKEDEDSYILIDESYEYKLKSKNLHMKCGWSPYENYKARGLLKEVYIRGTKVFDNGNILVEPGFGRNIAVS